MTEWRPGDRYIGPVVRSKIYVGGAEVGEEVFTVDFDMKPFEAEAEIEDTHYALAQAANDLALVTEYLRAAQTLEADYPESAHILRVTAANVAADGRNNAVKAVLCR